MSTRPAAPVEFATLALDGELGRGGQGSVHRVRNKRINESAADGGWEVVYKEYAPRCCRRWTPPRWPPRSRCPDG